MKPTGSSARVGSRVPLYLLIACCALAGCGGAHGAAEEGPRDARVAAPPPARDAPAGAGSRSAPPCPNVRQARRTFVGFAEGQDLEAFEATAYEGERVLRAVRVELCLLDVEHDPSGTLASAAADGAVEVTSVQFTRADLGAADVGVRAAGAEADGGGERRWTVAMERTADEWHVVAVIAK